jgi:hypothetical protein
VPSPGDLRAWMRSIQLLMSTLDCWAGIIVTRSVGGSWMYPQLHGWVTRWDYAGFICEPAVIYEV